MKDNKQHISNTKDKVQANKEQTGKTRDEM